MRGGCHFIESTRLDWAEVKPLKFTVDILSQLLTRNLHLPQSASKANAESKHSYFREGREINKLAYYLSVALLVALSKDPEADIFKCNSIYRPQCVRACVCLSE